MDFVVITCFNYAGCNFDTEISEIVTVVYDCAAGQIVDMYTPLNYYDMAVHGDSSINSSEDPLSLTDLETAQNNILQDINSTYEEESDISTVKSTKATRTSAVDSSKIVAYARKNYNKDQPASGNGSVPYYDFSEISGAYDCTNFVSHAILAGGAKVYDTGGSGISSTGWYYRSTKNRSSSWSGVNELHKYLVNNTHSNVASGISYNYSQNGATWGTGDIMQFSSSTSSTSYAHSTIITTKKKSSDGTRSYAYVTGRTGDDWYNNNQAASDIYPNGKKRTILVYNY